MMTRNKRRNIKELMKCCTSFGFLSYSYFQEYNPDVTDGGLNLQMKFISRKEARGLDARVILRATVGVMINGYTHEDQSTSPRRQRCTKKSVSQFWAGLYWWAGLDWYGGL